MSAFFDAMTKILTDIINSKLSIIHTNTRKNLLGQKTDCLRFVCLCLEVFTLFFFIEYLKLETIIKF